MSLGRDTTDDTMLKSQRHNRILSMLSASGQVHASALGEAFGVSSYTIRRDLDELAEAGQLKRVHGGAVLASRTPKTHDERHLQDLSQKEESARAALSLLAEDQLVIVDGGSTAEMFAGMVPLRCSATFITHCPATAVALATRSPAEIVLVGGRLDPFSRVAVGASAVEAYSNISADLCVVGLSGINVSKGIYSPHYEESLVRAAMINAANETVGLAITDKLGTGDAFNVAPATALTHLAVDAEAPEELTRPFEEMGIRVLRPDTSNGHTAPQRRPDA
jgi:DeoR/GlpR family transcriptional regulator of sugar metabolism